MKKEQKVADLKKKMTIDSMKNYLCNEVKGDLKQFFQFLDSSSYSLTVKDAEELLKEEIFQKAFSEEFGSKKEVSYESVENYCKEDENLTILVDLYLSENNIEVILENEEKSQKQNVLTFEEVVELTKQSQLGDTKALDKIIRNNMRLVNAVANRYTYFNMDCEDLIQEGSIGLMKAVLRFDPKKKCAFSTYAVFWIRQAITRYIADQKKSIRTPVYMQDNIKKMEKIIEKLISELGRKPEPEEIAAASEDGWTANKVKEILEVKEQDQKQITSLDKSILSAGEERTLGDLISSEEDIAEKAICKCDAQRLLLDIKECLSEREYKVFLYRSGFINNRKYTFDELGEMYGLTREAIRLSHKRAKETVKRYIKAKYTKKALGINKEEKNNQSEEFSIKSIHENITFSIFKSLLQLFPLHEIKLYTSYRRINLKNDKIYSIKKQDYPANLLHYMEIIENDLRNMYSYYEQLINTENISFEDAIKRIQDYMYTHSIRFRFSKHKQKEIYQAVKSLPDQYKKAICLGYGNNLSSYCEILEDSNQLFHESLIKLEETLEKKNQEVILTEEKEQEEQMADLVIESQKNTEKENIKSVLFEKYFLLYGDFISGDIMQNIVEEAVNSYSNYEGVSLEISSGFKMEKQILLYLVNQYKEHSDEKQLELLILVEELFKRRIQARYKKSCPYSDSLISIAIENTFLDYTGNKTFYIELNLNLIKNRRR